MTHKALTAVFVGLGCLGVLLLWALVAGLAWIVWRVLSEIH
jgi:hypothetical protein